MTSPFEGLNKKLWASKTDILVKQHPLHIDEIVKIVLSCWYSIFNSRIGKLKIGEDIFPTPQTMGLFLHELIPYELERKYPNIWSRARGNLDKDIVFLRDQQYSVEIKTSSHRSHIFGNRSYAQPDTIGAKPKTGYYITVNFQKFESGKNVTRPKIMLIRFGWLDHTDWIGQRAPTGQQARLSPETYKLKFLTLYDQKKSST